MPEKAILTAVLNTNSENIPATIKTRKVATN